MSVKVTGIRDVDRVIAKVDRNLTKERRAHIRKAAAITLVPAMKSRAGRSPGKAGPILARSVSARNGRNGAVLVGPRGGKRGAWFRHFFIAGAKAHEIGGARAAEVRRYTSASKQYRNTGGYFYRSIKARGRKFLYNPAGPFVATGPVRHPGFPDNPFVVEGGAAAQAAFIAEVRERLWVSDWRGGGVRPGSSVPELS